MNTVIDRPATPAASARQRSAASPPRVLVLGSHIFPDALEWHIVDSFRQFGCPVEFFQTQVAGSGTPGLLRYVLRKGGSMFLREPERLIESRLLRRVQQFEPTLILATLGNQISPKTIQRLRSVSRAAIVCWCQDQMTTIGRQFLLGAEYDAVFVKDRYMQDLFSRMIRSSRFFYLPEACNPRVHRTIPLSTEEQSRYGCDVMIAGTLYYYRQEILRQLAEFDLRIWGLRPDWLLSRLSSRLFGGPVFADDKARAVRGAKVCLNTLHYGEVDGLNCRAFEIAGCGGFQLITSVPVLAEHFEIGTEIVEFNTAEQLLELIRHFLDRPELAAQIALRGQQRAYRDHTFENRLREIMRITLDYEAVAS
jgi:spore maturation protein CgeB